MNMTAVGVSQDISPNFDRMREACRRPLPQSHGRSWPRRSNSRYQFPAPGRSIRHPREGGNFRRLHPPPPQKRIE